jgi:hypothetical protein
MVVYIQISILVLDAMLRVSLMTCCVVGTDGNCVITFTFPMLSLKMRLS